MVTSVWSLGRNGLYDWVVQRASAVIIAVYVVGLLGFLIAHPNLDHETWKAFMGCLAMQVTNTVVFVMVAAHAWIGVWTVLTDYVTKLSIKKHHAAVSLTAQTLMVLAVCVYLLLGLYMIWGGI